MDVQGFHNSFFTQVDKIGSLQLPSFEDWEVDLFLNKAMTKILLTRYGGNNIYKTGFEESQKRTDDLKNLVVSGYPFETGVSTNVPGIKESIYDLGDMRATGNTDVTADTNKYLFYVKSRVLMDYGTCIGVKARLSLFQQDDVEEVYEDPFNKPQKNKVVAYFENNKLLIQHSSDSTLTNVRVTFVRLPKPIDIGTYGNAEQDCELAEHLHEEVITEAVNLALENVESPRVQTQPIRENKQE